MKSFTPKSLSNFKEEIKKKPYQPQMGKSIYWSPLFISVWKSYGVRRFTKTCSTSFMMTAFHMSLSNWVAFLKRWWNIWTTYFSAKRRNYWCSSWYYQSIELGGQWVFYTNVSITILKRSEFCEPSCHYRWKLSTFLRFRDKAAI